MFLHPFPPFFHSSWLFSFTKSPFCFVCFCQLSISPLTHNEAFLPIPTISILIPVNYLSVLIHAFLSPLSHLLLCFFFCLCLIFPRLIPLFLLYVLNANGTTPSPMEPASSSTWGAPTRQGKRLEKRKVWQKGERETWRETLWRTESMEESLQCGSRSSPLLCNTIEQLSSTGARSTFCQWETESRAYEGGTRQRLKDTETKSEQDTQPLYRERGSGREVSPYDERRRGRITKAEKNRS